MSRLSSSLEPLDESDLRELRALMENVTEFLESAEEFTARANVNLDVIQRKLAALDVIFESRKY